MPLPSREKTLVAFAISALFRKICVICFRNKTRALESVMKFLEKVGLLTCERGVVLVGGVAYVMNHNFNDSAQFGRYIIPSPLFTPRLPETRLTN